MARQLHRLTDRQVKTVASPGLYGDGGGLGLRVQPHGGKSWSLRYQLRGKSRELGLGAYPAVTLKRARELAAEARAKLAEQRDPFAEREAHAAAVALAEAKNVTFKEFAEAYILRKKPEWSNPKHAGQWTATFEQHVYPKIGHLGIADIDTDLVLDVLNEIWIEKTVTAQRVRGRIENVLDAARVQGKRAGENPARWRGHLQVMLPNPRKVQNVRHFPSLDYAALPEFFARLKDQPGEAARALQFTILTAARTVEVIGLTWREIDTDKFSTWTIPKERMKARREHRVPLSAEAAALLKENLKLQLNGSTEIVSDSYVFPTYKMGMPLSNNAMLALLDRMDCGHLTVHGFRSSFRMWCAEATGYPREVAEAALSHVIDDKTEAAYQRSDLFERRRKLMAEWAAFATTPKAVPARGKVVSIGGKRKGA
jgi:integrase